MSGAILLGLVSGQDQPPGMADIFFLDLGIVIEPATGNEAYSREIGKTSEEVQFKIKKVKSGSVYMAASQEMMDALARIQERMDRLEQSFQNEIGSLNEENRQLRNTISNMNTALVKTRVDQLAQEKDGGGEQMVKAAPVENPKPAPEKKAITTFTPTPAVKETPVKHLESFSMTDYMSGLFAYEREDYRKAIEIFNQLNLSSAKTHVVENVLYWKADAYQHLGDNRRALEHLDQLLNLRGGSRKDDALIKQGLLLRKVGLEDRALLSFSILLKDFPESEYARLAQLELNKAEKLQ